MWFVFGLITLTAAVFWNLAERTRANWRGERRRSDNINYELQVTVGDGKRRANLLRIGMDIPDQFHFIIRRETERDRWYKRAGITAERQLGDARFDRVLYLESDDAVLGELLAERVDLRDALLEVLNDLSRTAAGFLSLRCMQGRIWFEVAPPNEKQHRRIEQALIGPLHAFAQALRTLRPRSELGERDPFVRRAALVLAFSTGLFVFGFVWLMREKFVATPLLDPWGMFFVSLLPSLAAWALFVYLVLRWLGRSSRTHLVLIEVMTLGALGFLLGGFFLAREINMALDFRPVRAAVVEKASLRALRSRKGGTSYYIELDGAIDTTGRHREIRIDGDTYSRLQAQAGSSFIPGYSTIGPLRLQVRPGALGFEWVESIAVVEPQK